MLYYFLRLRYIVAIALVSEDDVDSVSIRHEGPTPHVQFGITILLNIGLLSTIGICISNRSRIPLIK